MVNPGNAEEMEQYLKGFTFPLSKKDLINTARSSGVPEAMISILEDLPGDEYNTPVDLMNAYGEAFSRAQNKFWNK